jgi:hypothetical protein
MAYEMNCEYCRSSNHGTWSHVHAVEAVRQHFGPFLATILGWEHAAIKCDSRSTGGWDANDVDAFTFYRDLGTYIRSGAIKPL